MPNLFGLKLAPAGNGTCDNAIGKRILFLCDPSFRTVSTAEFNLAKICQRSEIPLSNISTINDPLILRCAQIHCDTCELITNDAVCVSHVARRIPSSINLRRDSAIGVALSHPLYSAFLGSDRHDSRLLSLTMTPQSTAGRRRPAAKPSGGFSTVGVCDVGKSRLREGGAHLLASWARQARDTPRESTASVSKTL